MRILIIIIIIFMFAKKNELNEFFFSSYGKTIFFGTFFLIYITQGSYSFFFCSEHEHNALILIEVINIFWIKIEENIKFFISFHFFSGLQVEKKNILLPEFIFCVCVWCASVHTVFSNLHLKLCAL